MKRKTRAPRRVELRLPPLEPYGGGLGPDGDYDGLELAGLDLTGASGEGARFLDCAVRECVLDEARLTGAGFLDSRLEAVRGVGTDLARARLRDAEVVDARFGGTQLHGSAWERVLVRGGKWDYPNLRAATLRDVVFEGCVLVEPDFGGAVLERVSFVDCELTGVDVSGAKLVDVDLRGVRRLEIARGVESLAGAVISSAQLLDLAPVFAARLGVRVED
ncbi:pentapeptide repeat-containing protein [Streptomyces sp. NPDC004435]|uniref:pentapeptide repeat-containing protein n=1 Tax=Streptomyces sp. NPDC004435 TaxID=3364701 RepID=UPI0036C1ABD3